MGGSWVGEVEMGLEDPRVRKGSGRWSHERFKSGSSAVHHGPFTVLLCFYTCVASCEWATRKALLSGVFPLKGGRVVAREIVGWAREKPITKSQESLLRKKWLHSEARVILDNP